jgi:hypothetical protein
MPSFFSQLAHSNLSHPLFRNPDRIPDCPKRRARFPCPRNRPVTTDSARNLLLQPPDHCALDACALFRACGSPGTRLFLLAYVRGIRKRRPTQAMQPSQHRASARSELLRDLRSRKTLRFQPPQPLIPLGRPETPRYPPHLPHAPPFSERSHSRHPCGSRNHQTPNLKPSRQRRLNPTIPPHGGPATSGECSPDPALGCTPSTDIGRHSEEGSFVPRAAVSRCSKVRVQLGLLDHLIRGHKKARCHREADAMSRHRTRCLL